MCESWFEICIRTRRILRHLEMSCHALSFEMFLGRTLEHIRGDEGTSPPHAFLEALCALFSCNLVLFWNKTRWPFYRSPSVRPYLILHLEGSIHTFSTHEKLSQPTGWDIDTSLVFLLSFSPLQIFQRVQGAQSLTVCFLFELDNIADTRAFAALSLNCMKLPFYPPAKKKRPF